MPREMVTLTQKEQHRVHVLTQVQHGALVASAAATLLALSVRQIRRLLAGLRHRGLAALAHGNRGHASPRRLPEAIRTQVITLARTTYAGLNDHHLTDCLQDHAGLHVSRPTVYRWLRAAGVPRPRSRRAPRHRSRRTRMPQLGMLVQLDASHHPWLEDRGPVLVLLAAIDDATSRVVGALFRPTEDARGYLALLRALARAHGLPLAVYTDRHGIFQRDTRTPLTLAEQLHGTRALTQVGRALHDLGIRWIPAASPQAKGRIERLFGTLQDRLVAELRVAHASSLSDATRVLRRFLRRFNRRFARPAAQPQSAFRPAPPGAALEAVCCLKYRRTVARDNTVQLGPICLQLLPGPQHRSYAGVQIDLQERLDGTIAAYYQSHRLAVRAVPISSAPPHPLALPAPAAPTGPRRYVPPAPEHPWRRYDEIKKRKQLQTQGVTFSLNY